MEQVYKFFALSAAERGILISAALRLVTTRLAVAVLPLRILFRPLPWETSSVKDPQAGDAGLPPERIAWAVHVASRYLPGTRNCLVRALTVQLLLVRDGYPACLCLGVARDEDGEFKAHAWVKCGGKILIGAAGMSQYAPLQFMEAQRR